jgi:hypothetical protein
MKYIAAILPLTITTSAFAAPCELPAKVVAGKVAPCDGIAVKEETLTDLANKTKDGAECVIKLSDAQADLERAKIESDLKLKAKEEELQVERNLNEAAQSKIAALTKAPEFWQTPEFWGGVGFGLGVAFGVFVATR